MATALATWLLASLTALATGELLLNGGFESTDHWNCWNIQCATTNDKHSGQHALKVSGRTHHYQGPTQNIHVTPGHAYIVSAWVKLLNDLAGQTLKVMVNFQFTDGTTNFATVASHVEAKSSDGWTHLQGSFTAPSRAFQVVRLHVQSGPSASAIFLVDDVSVTELAGTVTTADLDLVIDQERKSDIHVRVTTAPGINTADVRIHVLQKKKSFPFGTAVNARKYNGDAAGGRYRDFIHQHFNWAVPKAALKWPAIERQRGHMNYHLALDMIHELKTHGLKVRGHSLVWSVAERIQDWVKQLSGADLKNAIKQHIEETMNMTRGLLEHWDVNNENLHGQWFQNRLNDSSYNLELFREAHRADPNVKLFLNDYDVVAAGGSTYDYLAQAKQFKAANVGLYGIGVQCHFGNEQEPNAAVIKQRLDLLAQAGVPIWVTELDVQAQDENRRADFYEKALRSFYGHPAVEGILFWGFWDQLHWRGEKAALVRGDNLELTAAGRRVLDLLENQWMTDETHGLSGNQLTVRGFHGDYEVLVVYQGRELGHLKQTFALGKRAHSVHIHVHT